MNPIDRAHDNEPSQLRGMSEHSMSSVRRPIRRYMDVFPPHGNKYEVRTQSSKARWKENKIEGHCKADGKITSKIGQTSGVMI